MKAMPQKTERIDYLKQYYQTHSQMVLNRSLVPWKCHKSFYLYVEGWIKHKNAQTVRIRKSMAEAYMLQNMMPVIREKELIVGQPDFSPFTPEEEQVFAEYQSISSKGIPLAKGRGDHMALDYRKLLEKGILGVLAELDGQISQINFYDGREAERYELYQCCKIELEGMLSLAEHYREQALALAEKSEGDAREEYLSLADVLARVPAHPASTFREALQSIQLFVYPLFGMYSMGRPDQYLYPYYKRDIENGMLTPTQAQELIDCFYLQYMNNMSAWSAASLMIGGRDENGLAVENEVTWHFLCAIEHTRIPDPNVGLCVTDQTGEDLLDYAIQLIRQGCGQPQIWNQDGIAKSLLSYGYDPKTANLFTQSTCVEITPIGCSGVSITSPYINTLNVFLKAFEECDDGMDFDGIYSAFERALEDFCKRALWEENLYQLERKRNGTDPTRISVFVNDCIKRGLSSDSGGALYNDIEPNLVGMINVVESFNVINELVFVQKKLTVSQLQAILESNYESAPELLAYIRNRVPHFGTNTEQTNAMAKRVADTVLSVFKKFTTFRGAHFIPGAFSYREHELQGRNTGASPDGRRAGDVLADGSCPVQGYDRMGPTFSLNSTTAWEPLRFPGGISVNMKLSPSVSASQIKALILGYFAEGGIQLQFNVIDSEMLKDAQSHPDRYGDILVRIGGYSDYFTKIPKRLQDDVISRSQN